MPKFPIDVPVVDDLSRAWWDAARKRKLLIQRCPECGNHQFYPRPHCVHCHKGDPEWVEAKGTGTLSSFSVLHRVAHPEFQDKTPYVFAIVELDEGVRMSTNIVETDLDELECDMPVALEFAETSGDYVLPVFRKRA